MTLKAALAARAHQLGRAQRTAQLRHRAISSNPIGITGWLLGAEPYTVAALGAGTQKAGCEVYVPGYPLNRDLLFGELLRFAKFFCPAFEAAGGQSGKVINRFGQELLVPDRLPQIVVPNRETLDLLGRLGRRLAYLPTDGAQPADPLLPRLGRHLTWLAEYYRTPGQQLVLVATDLLNAHWQTAMSSYETASLAALNAWIDPPAGVHGFDAAVAAEKVKVGPRPDRTIGEDVQRLMKVFNAARAGKVDPAVIGPLRKPLTNYYGTLLTAPWGLMWQVINRERLVPEAPSVQKREFEDRVAYASQLSWMNGPAKGLRRTRQTARNAALSLSRMEAAQNLLAAEEAIDDPIRMASIVLAGNAISGQVVGCEAGRRERVGGQNVLRPRVTIKSDEPCMMPVGKQLWWTLAADKAEWEISSVANEKGGGSVVSVILQTNRSLPAGLPSMGKRACFSELNTREPYELHLPDKIPWTHQNKLDQAKDSDLEHTAGQEAA